MVLNYILVGCPWYLSRFITKLDLQNSSQGILVTLLLVTTGRIHITWSSPKNIQAGQVGVSLNPHSLIFKEIISISMQLCEAFSMRGKIISRFFTKTIVYVFTETIKIYSA